MIKKKNKKNKIITLLVSLNDKKMLYTISYTYFVGIKKEK